jgi:pimeloyl-ACP methyl ester carboxylesterase
MQLMSNDEWAKQCNNDGEFAIAARRWRGGIKLTLGDQTLALKVNEGVVQGGAPESPEGVIEFQASLEVWEKMLAQEPPRFHNDVMANISTGMGISRSGDFLAGAQYYGAAMRGIELIRVSLATPNDISAPQQRTTPNYTIDAPVGRYVHLHLDGFDHRIYFEEAGQGGIPLLLQHTAGCHGSQWRHLFEDPRITERFHLIAYDLPFHGKSLPPTDKNWWSEEYALRGEFLRSIPLALSRALKIERPVFMGCSVGGLLSLDLAHKHADEFRAVISVEGALKIGGDLANLQDLWHPQIGSQYKARLMEGLMSPRSPEYYRKETSFVYASGWPALFIGDLYYYIKDFDLTEFAQQIDTSKVGVHILSGEYDYSGTVELGEVAHNAIAGSTWTMMQGVGHFPMSENPDQFIQYLMPILEQIS